MLGVAAAAGNDMAEDGAANQRQIAYKVQNFVADKFIGKAEAAFVQDAVPVPVNGNYIVKGTAESQSVGPELFNLFNKGTLENYRL